MIFPVTIGPMTLDWRLKDGPRLNTLLRRQPWDQEGGIFSLALCSLELAGPINDRLRQAIRAEDDGAHALQCVQVEPEWLGQGLRAGLAQAAGLPPTMPEGALITQLARLHREGAYVFTLPVTPTQHGLLHPQAMGLREAVLNLESPFALTLFFLIERMPEQGEGFDLRTGAPLEWLLEHSRSGELEALWPRYLHHRIAWESGGRPDRAQRWGDCRPVLELIKPDDERLEEILNLLALREWKDLRPEVQQQALALLDRLTGAKATPSLLGQANLLFQEAMLTGPEGAEELLFAPWVARALLQQPSLARGKSWLRQALVCLPIVQECLARCFTLESLVRTRLSDLSETVEFSEETRRRHQYFTRPDKSWERRLLPDHHPGPPDALQDFAGLGELLSLHQTDRKRHPLYWELLDLRNLLAHGHYASWATLVVLHRVEKGLRWQGG